MLATKTDTAPRTPVAGTCRLAGHWAGAAPWFARAAEPVKFMGAISGVVRNSLGVPQMGAVVLLYNRQDRNLDKILSDSTGRFQFSDLVPDLYSVKVSVATLVPALKKNILVQPGMQSMLAVNLNSLFIT